MRGLIDILTIAVQDDDHNWDLQLPTILLAYEGCIIQGVSQALH